MAMVSTTHGEIRVDRSLCMGSGQCCWYAPNTFDQDDETVAIVIDPAGRPGRGHQGRREACPTRALSIVDGPRRKQQE